MQKAPIAAIQGENGSNSATAARMLLGDDVQFIYCDSFQSAFDALDSGKSDCAVLPIENTTAGLIQPVWDRILGISPGPAMAARQEARVRIGFVAAALPGHRSDIRKILAHSVAAAQCHRFLKGSGWNIIPCHDTAGGAGAVGE